MHLEAVVHAHAAAFLGRTPWDVAHDEVQLADAHATAWRCYRHRTVMAGIDPYVAEAEGWGAELRPAAGEPARFEVVAPVLGALGDTGRLPDLDPASRPLMAASLGAARRLASIIPGGVAVPVAGPLALAVALAGIECVHAAFEADAEKSGAALLALVGRMRPWLRAIAASGAQATICEAPFDASFTSPAVFRAALKPALTLLVHETQLATCSTPALLLEGNTTSIAADLCATGASMIVCPTGVDRIAFLEQANRFPEVAVRVDVARGLWGNGNWPSVCKAIAEARPAARRHPRTILGTGALPLQASSVMVVDACGFAANMDPWIEPT